MKGIILAGGYGTRLYPLTKVLCKQLLPVFDKPMIYYPLSTLMLCQIKEVLIISTPHDIELFKELFGIGDKLGMKFSYAVQKKPNGIAEAFKIGEDFIKNDNIALILGDNIFYGHSFNQILLKNKKMIETSGGSVIFGYYVKDPSSYGVIEFDKNGRIEKIIEKPKKTVSNFAVPGLYFFDNQAVKIAKNLKPSPRGELEITDIINKYINNKKLNVEILHREMTWLDAGTTDHLLEAGNFIKAIQSRQGIYTGCIEEIAFMNGWITRNDLIKLSDTYKTEYGEYLKYIAGEKNNGI